MRICLTAFLALSVLASPARACECDLLQAEEVAQRAMLFFTGNALQVDDKFATFENMLPIKGYQLLRARIALNRPGNAPDCAASFSVGNVYAVVARGNFDDGYYTDACLQRQINENVERQMQISALLLPTAAQVKPLLDHAKLNPLDLVTARQIASIFLAAHDPEMAFGQFNFIAGKVVDPTPDQLGQGEALLMMGPTKAREALARFDDVLEKIGDNQQAWSGRNRALVLMNRWSELPESGADLAGLSLEQTAFGADLQDVSLANGWLEDVDAAGRKLAGLNLTTARVIHVNFAKAGLESANFTRARVNRSDFSGALLKGAAFNLARLQKINFAGADLTNADFTGAQLSDVDFTGAILTGAKVDSLTADKVIWPTGFTPPKAAEPRTSPTS